MECINLDAWEISRNGSNDRTIDTAVGIADFDTIRQTDINHRLLLVELKLDLTGRGFNLRKSELQRKDTHSRQALLINERVDSATLYLIPEDRKAEARSFYSRWLREPDKSSISHWQFLTPTELNTLIADPADHPYQPQTDPKAISQSISSCIDAESLNKEIETWIQKAQEYATSYNHHESNHIKATLLTAFNNHIDNLPSSLSPEDMEILHLTLATLKE